MIRLSLAAAFAGAFLLAGGVAAGPLEEAKTAFASGDYARAMALWRPAAESGNPEAQNRVGLLYLAGQGVEKNAAEAVRWFRLAATKGLADAQFNLAECYASGQGVTQDPTSADQWYAKAADQGHAGAEYKMGVLLRTGADLQSVLLQAAEWFRKAADQGVVAAQISLAVMFVEGKGVPQDNVEALTWLDIVARRLPDADNTRRADVDKIRAALAAKMAPRQVADAQNVADRWEPTQP